MHILRIEFDDLSDRPQRLSIHRDEEQAKLALYEYVRENWSEFFDESPPLENANQTDSESFIEEYFEEIDQERYTVDFVYLAGPDPFDTIEALQGLVASFVRERIESIVDDIALDNSFVAIGDFETLEGLDDDTRDRIGHVRFFLTEANRIVSRHGIAPLSP